MPRAKRVCSEPGCATLVDTGRCGEHARPAWNGGRQANRNGSGWEQQRRHKAVLARDGGMCQIGGDGCRLVASEVDHANGDPRNDDPANLRAVCRPCHDAKTRREARAARGGG